MRFFKVASDAKTMMLSFKDVKSILHTNFVLLSNFNILLKRYPFFSRLKDKDQSKNTHYEKGTFIRFGTIHAYLCRGSDISSDVITPCRLAHFRSSL